MVLSKISRLRLKARWIAWRNDVLGSSRFQQFAVRFPLTRPVARQRARALFDLVAGFTYSQILFACIETGLLELLANGPCETSKIAAKLDLSLCGAERLLRGAAALELVEPLGSGWVLGSAGAALRGNRGIAEMVAHHDLLYADLADPVALLRRDGGGGALSRHWHYAESAGQGSNAAVSRYSALMSASQPLVAEQIIKAYPFRRHNRLLDVGGGDGAFLTAVGSRVAGLDLALFDLPAVGELARARFELADMTARAKVFGGNFLDDPLPGGFDLVSLVRVLHDHDEVPALALLRNIHLALPPGGRLLVAEPMAQIPGAEPVGDAYFGFYLLAMGSGKPRSPTEIRRLLKEAGFSRSRVLKTDLPLTTGAIIASR